MYGIRVDRVLLPSCIQYSSSFAWNAVYSGGNAIYRTTLKATWDKVREGQKKS
jgi:hypothetical protein